MLVHDACIEITILHAFIWVLYFAVCHFNVTFALLNTAY